MNKCIYRVLVLCCLLSLANRLRADRTIVLMETNYGDVTIELYDTKAPATVENFLNYVNRGFYDGLIFHRIVADFMIQGGVYDPNLYQADFASDDFSLHDPNYWHEPGDPIDLEVDADLKNLRGRIAMARTSDPDSATSQFFINTVDNDHLDPSASNDGYAVFGEVALGMGVVDDIESVAINTDAEITPHFSDGIPQEPVIIESIRVIRKFDPNSPDFSDVPFLHAADGTVRTLAGQDDYSDSTVRHEFENITYLDVECLQWKQIVESSESVDLDDFTMVLARDSGKGMWILKYVLNEDTVDERTIIEADTFSEATSFEEFAETNMHFRLITGAYNENNPADPNNIITQGTGSDRITQQITSVDASLPPNYSEDNLVLVKWSRGAEGSETDIDWFYYRSDLSLIMVLEDDSGDTDGDGWRLTPMSFDGDSTDFSNIPFLRVPTDTDLVRTYVGQGSFADMNYTHTFSVATEQLQGVSYLSWQQNWENTSETSNAINTFTLHLARDVLNRIWVFKYELNNITIVDVDSIIEAVLLDTFNDDIIFKLITGNYNADNIGDPNNIIIRGLGADSETEKILGFTASLDHIPHYQTELVQVKKWAGTVENNNDLFYYHESTGLIQNLRDGTTGRQGDGWHLAFNGGTFSDETSDDFSDVSFLRAQPDTSRTLIGQGSLKGLKFLHTFNQRSFHGINCLKWDMSGVSADVQDNAYLYLARDSLNSLWVFKYYINGNRVFYADTKFDAKPLTDYADDNMYFRLITGLYNPNNLADPNNIITTVSGGKTVTEQIVSFNATLDHMPFYKDNLVLVKNTRDIPDPNNQWMYFHESLGPVLQLTTASDNPADPNYFNPDIPGQVTDTTRNAWRLGWYGREEPQFSAGSDDLSDVPFLKSQSGDVRLYRGQGDFADSSYRMSFANEELFGIDCLNISETAVPAWNKADNSMCIAKDENDQLWLFNLDNEGQTDFAAPALDQIVPFDWVEDIRFNLMRDQYNLQTSVTIGQIPNTLTEQITDLTGSLEPWPDFDDELVLIKTFQDPNDAIVDWRYFHESAGMILDLWDNPAEPNSAGNGWFLEEPAEMEDITISLKAGKSRELPTDRFTLWGTFDANLSDFTDSEIDIRVGPYQTTILTTADGFKQMGTKSLFIYKGKTPGGGTLRMKFDLTQNRFYVSAKKVNLTGIDNPIRVVIVVGGYHGTGTAETKNKNIPIRLFQGHKDELRHKRYLYVSDNRWHNDYIVLKGQISTKTFPLDLEGKTATIKWGGSTYSIPSGNAGLQRRGNREKFTYANSAGPLNYARFDLDKFSYKIIIKESFVANPPADIEITLKDGSDVLFDQEVSVPD